MGKDLFEEILHNLQGCQYISDLRAMVEKKNVSELKKALLLINCDDYSVSQWNELLNYLFGVVRDNKTSQEAYKIILDLLDK